MAPRGGGGVAGGGGSGFLYHHPTYPPATTVYAHTTTVPPFYNSGRYTMSPMTGSPIERMPPAPIGYPGKILCLL